MHTSRSILSQVLLLLIIISICVFPFYWMVTTSLKTQIVALEAPPVWVFEPTLDNYREALFEDGVFRTLINSLLIAVSTTTLALILGVPAAFALARFEFRGKKDLWFWFITNRMVSPIVLALPFFLIARNLGMLDKHITLILIYLTFNLPIVIWIVTDQFRGIPYDLDEAARLEGASQFTIMGKICLGNAGRGGLGDLFVYLLLERTDVWPDPDPLRSQDRSSHGCLLYGGLQSALWQNHGDLDADRYSRADLCADRVETACAWFDYGSGEVNFSTIIRPLAGHLVLRDSICVS